MLITSTLTFTCSNSTIVTPYLSVFSPNAGKYGPEKTRYLDTFHAVIIPPTLLRKTLQHRCVLVKFANTLRTPCFTEHFRFLAIRGHVFIGCVFVWTFLYIQISISDWFSSFPGKVVFDFVDEKSKIRILAEFLWAFRGNSQSFTMILFNLRCRTSQK